MKRLFIAADGRLRNGWWVVVFIAVFLLSRLAYAPLRRALEGVGIAERWLEPTSFAMIVLVTWVCVRLRGERLASIGFGLDRRWFREAGGGTLLGIGSALLAVGLMWLAGGVRLELDPARSASFLLVGLYVFLCVSLFEETLFRGFVFQRLLAGCGVWVAQAAMALLFAASHWGNPDMHGATLLIASTELALAAVMLGLAYIRTRSLALPIGIHLGWNWAQGSVLGFDVSGFEQAGWFRPRLLDAPEWITGGAFGMEASVCALASDLLLIGVLWRWRGSRPAPDGMAVPKAATAAAQSA